MPPRRRIRRIARASMHPIRYVVHKLKSAQRAQIASRVLEKYGLSGQSLKECAKALAELDAHWAALQAVNQTLERFPLSAKKSEENPQLHKEYTKWVKRREDEQYYYNERLWKLLLELDSVSPGNGGKLLVRVHREYTDFFVKNKKGNQ